MIWGKELRPFTAAPLFKVWAPKPDAVPGDIQVAIADLVEAVQRDMNEMCRASAVAANEADRALQALILKHLRGEV